MNTRLSIIIVVTLLGVAGVAIVYHKIQINHLNETIATLHNEVAAKDKTIEVQAGVYTKLAQDHTGLVKMFSETTVQNQELTKELLANKDKLVAATDAVGYWKGLYEKTGSGRVEPVHESPIITHGTSTPILPGVQDFISDPIDFGFIAASCRVRTTSPPQFKIGIDKGSKQLGLRVAMAQDKTGAWHTYVTSDDARIGIDILATAIDTSQFQPRWYDKISFALELGVSGDGILAGLGAQYRVGSFDIGPRFWATTNSTRYFGGSVIWYPF